MRRRSWQGKYGLGLLVVLAFVGCLGTCARHQVVNTDETDAAHVSERSVRQVEDEASGADDADGKANDSERDEMSASALEEQSSAEQAAGNGISVSVQAGDVEQVAIHLLTSYRDAQNCVLVSSGYLDLLGLVWGCVVQGDGWVDVCTVTEDQTEDSCKVSVLHMEASELAEVFAEDDAP